MHTFHVSILSCTHRQVVCSPSHLQRQALPTANNNNNNNNNKITTTGSSQSLSPFWLTETSSRELSQIPGATSSSFPEPPADQSPAFSLLHAAAITGDVEGGLNVYGLVGGQELRSCKADFCGFLQHRPERQIWKNSSHVRRLGQLPGLR